MAATDNLLQTIGIPAKLPAQIDLPGNNVLDVNELNKAVGHAAGQTTEFIVNTALALLLVAGTWIFTRWLSGWLQRGLLRARVEETFAVFISSIVMYLLFLLAFLAGLRLMGVSDTSLVTVLGASALAVGFALRGTLTHVASGIMLITSRPFRIGDWIQLDVLEGRVKRITLFNTEISTLDNKRVFVPNTKLWEGNLTNHTYSRERMVEAVIRASYGTPPDEMKKLYFDALKADERILPRPEPTFGIKAMVPEGVDYLVRAWVRTGDYNNLKLELPIKLWNAMIRAKLTIPSQPWAEGQPQQPEQTPPEPKPAKGKKAAAALALCALMAFQAHAADTDKTPVVVETFTSEYCPNCPAGEATLAGKAENRSDFIVVLEHVDYWDDAANKHIDPLGSPDITQRQYDYSNRLGRRPGEVFTPAPILDGAAMASPPLWLGFDGILDKALASNSKKSLTLKPLPGGAWQVSGLPAGREATVTLLSIEKSPKHPTLWQARGISTQPASGTTMTLQKPLVPQGGTHLMALWQPQNGGPVQGFAMALKP